MSKAVLLGPYVGSFTQEILVFRPHIRYISETVIGAELYVSSHSNRSFLYDWIKPSNFLPIYDHISRNEPGQTGFIYDEITKTEFNQITKKIRSEIDHSDVDIHTLPYVKSTNGVSYYQKLFSPFDIPDYDINHDDLNIVAIFNKSEQSQEVFDFISKMFNVVVIGDMNNGLEDDNVLMKNLDLSNNYLKMFNYINKSKLVVTNCSDWALICNCQGIPVYYWGTEHSLFKNNGVLNFGNNKCTSICNMDSQSVADMVGYCYKNLYESE
jgi:hypothetical protein